MRSGSDLADESGSRLFDFGIVLMVFAAIAKTVPLVAVIYAYSRLSHLDELAAGPAGSELVYLQSLLFYGTNALVIFVAIFTAGALLVVFHRKSRL